MRSTTGRISLAPTYAFSGATHDLTEGNMRIGSFDCIVLHLPGHTPGGCALIFDGQCLSGDSLFAGSNGPD